MYDVGKNFGEEYGKTVAKTTVKAATYLVIGAAVDGATDLMKKD